MVRIILILLIAYSLIANSQPTIDISFPSEICKNEIISFSNASSGTDYFWEFCSSGIDLPPIVPTSVVINEANGPDGVRVVYDNGNWYGFSTSTNSNSILRLDFGIDLNNSPNVVDLGNPSGLLLRPRDITILKHQGNWYALIANYDVGTGINKIVRLSFGSSITNIAPTSENLGDFSGRISQPSSIEWIIDGADAIAIVASRSDRKLHLINFSNAPEKLTFQPQDFIEVQLPGGGFLRDFSLVKIEEDWVGLTISESGTIQKLLFTGNLFQVPDIDIITGNFPAINSPSNVLFIRDIDRYYAFIQEYGGNLIQLAFNGNPLSLTPSFTNMGNLGILQNCQGLAYARQDNGGFLYTSNIVTSRFYTLQFSPSECQSTTTISRMVEPSLAYSQSGYKTFSLIACDGNSACSLKIDSIYVKENPQADFNYSLNCTGQNTLLQDATVADGSLTWTWDFDDPTSSSNSSILQNPEHQFSTFGNFMVKLSVIDDCGNSDEIIKDVNVNDASLVALDIDAEDPICSNQIITYDEVTNVGPGLISSAFWDFGNGETSAEISPEFVFESEGLFNIRLDAVVNQCVKTAFKDINVKRGALVLFDYAGSCEQSPINFSNQTLDADLLSFTWNFNDGITSPIENPEHLFGMSGLYQVTLAVTNSLGCETELSKSIQIFSKPQPNFAIDLPPFSCSGSSSQFNDLTPNPTDSNLAGWTWSFGDPLNGTSNVRNAVYTFSTAAQYDVNLEVSTNFGCKASVQKAISISQSPDPAFSFNPACVNQATIFTPTSTSGVNSWQWKIGTSTYNQQSPTHVFSFPSAYTAKLTATGANGCVAVLTKPVIVPTAASVDFISENNCATQNASFTDLTTTGSDPISTRTWQFGTLGTGTGMTPTFNFPTSGSYPVKLTVTSEAGCSYSISKNVDIVNAPVVTFNATPLTGVPPLTVKFQNTSANSVAQLWKVNDADNSTSSENSPSFVFSELGQYVVDLTVVNADGCSNTQSKVISVITPSLDIELVNLTLVPANNGEANLLLTLLNNSNSPVSHIKAIIDVAGDALISEVINAVILPGESHSQILSTGIIGSKGNADFVCVELAVDGDVNYTNNKLCINTGSTIVVFDPYPNPGSDQLNLDWVANSPGASEVYIFDRTGRKVFDNTISNYLEGFNHLTISLAPLNPGLYYVLFVSDGSRKSFPFVLRR